MIDDLRLLGFIAAFVLVCLALWAIVLAPLALLIWSL